MSRFRAILINPTSPHWRVNPGSAPRTGTKVFRFSMLSSLYVAASLSPYADVRIIDEDVEPVDDNLDADLVGISFMTYNAPRAYELADRIRNHQKIPVIAGGFHPTFMTDEALAHFNAVCVGEAEANIPAMISDFKAGRLRGAYRHDLVQPETIPIPDRSLLKRGAYYSVEAVQATRGCTHQCTFCSITSFFDHRFRKRPVDSVIEELKPLGRSLLFMDDNITLDPSYAAELFTRMIPLRKQWYSQCSISIASNPTLLDLAARSGCRGLFIGFESLSDQVLSSWHKSTNIRRDYIRDAERIHRAGIGIYAGIVLGYDGDGPETFGKTLDFLREANIDALQATILTPFPGTPLWDTMSKDGRILDTDWGHYDFRHVVFQPTGMTTEALKAGHDWLLSKFYSRCAILARSFRALAYMPLPVVATVPLPLNLAYRQRLKTDGTLHT